jgi:hypothetical protein
MARVGSRAITYICVAENDSTPYLVKESDMRPSGKTSVEIGSVTAA